MAPTEAVKVPDGLRVAVAGRRVTVEGPKGKVTREFAAPGAALALRGKEIVISIRGSRRPDRALLGTWRGHLGNMFDGASHGLEYRLKIVYTHFPIKAQTKGASFVIENFLGEKSARTVELLPGVKAEVKGDVVSLTGADVEALGACASRIEQATKIRDRDPRVFQDGIYITTKGTRAGSK
jgi:large subunit ribosomal protein L6